MTYPIHLGEERIIGSQSAWSEYVSMYMYLVLKLLGNKEVNVLDILIHYLLMIDTCITGVYIIHVPVITCTYM